MSERDPYQQRYLEHQSRKKEVLEKVNGEEVLAKYSLNELYIFKKILENRRSQRIFNDISITEDEMSAIMEAVRLSPSSCNRQAVYLIEEKDKNYIERTLVGGLGWMSRADRIILLFADKLAYKAPGEKQFMPYLDAGAVLQSIYLMCEILNIGCCFVNPNIRNENKPQFVERYGDDYFCGAFVIGNYDKKASRPPLRDINKVLRK